MTTSASSKAWHCATVLSFPSPVLNVDTVSDCCRAYFTVFSFIGSLLQLSLYCSYLLYNIMLCCSHASGAHSMCNTTLSNTGFPFSFATDSKYNQAPALFRSCTPPCTHNVTGRSLQHVNYKFTFILHNISFLHTNDSALKINWPYVFMQHVHTS